MREHLSNMSDSLDHMDTLQVSIKNKLIHRVLETLKFIAYNDIQ